MPRRYNTKEDDFGYHFGEHKISNRKIPKYDKLGDGPSYYIPMRVSPDSRRWKAVEVIQIREPGTTGEYRRFALLQKRGEPLKAIRLDPSQNLVFFRYPEDAIYWGPKDEMRAKLLDLEVSDVDLSHGTSELASILNSSERGDKEDNAFRYLSSLSSDLGKGLGEFEDIKDATGLSKRPDYRTKHIKEAFKYAEDDDDMYGSIIKPSGWSRKKSQGGYSKQEHLRNVLGLRDGRKNDYSIASRVERKEPSSTGGSKIASLSDLYDQGTTIYPEFE